MALPLRGVGIGVGLGLLALAVCAAPPAAAAPDAASLQRDRALMADAALATLFAVVGLLSFAAASRRRAGRVPALLLGAAMVLHCSTLLAGSERVRAALGGPPGLWAWLGTVAQYAIGVPWALLLEQLAGRGWRSSLRLTWLGFAAFAVLAVLVDVAAGRPGTASPLQPAVIMAGALVGFANLSLGRGGRAPELRVLRAGYLVFLAVVVHDNLARMELLPWRWSTPNQFGLLVFIGCLIHTVVSRTVRGQRQLQAIEHELATARRIQASLLPSAAPALQGLEVAFRHVPAAAVAGDLFQFLERSPRSTGVLVADVAGHGVPAALIASMVKVAAAAQRPHADQPARVLAGIHATLADELPPGEFVTAVYVYVDLDRRLLLHASAGHPPALVLSRSAARVEPAGGTGPLLIALAPAEYPVTEIPLAAGDRVVLYTDGVVEARRGDDQMFGEERLQDIVRDGGADPAAFVAAVVDAVGRFTGRPAGPFEDDLTLVALQVTAGP